MDSREVIDFQLVQLFLVVKTGVMAFKLFTYGELKPEVPFVTIFISTHHSK